MKKPLKKRRDADDHFRVFAGQLQRVIASYGEMPEGVIQARQRQQLDRLVSLEGEFKQTLIKHRWGADVYRAFVTHITEERRNILAARPYFRERQEVFTESISEELKRGNDKGLYPFDFNYAFIRFALSAKPWPVTSKIAKLERTIAAARWELVEMNMPLAIARSRIFWKRTPESHLEYMDFVQIAAEGLLVAIDKFCPSAQTAFRHVAIGRMVGFFIEQYSETMIHFFPTDKRKIYRANKVANRFSRDAQRVDWEKLAEAVNAGVDDAQRTTSIEIASLMLAASMVSADAPVSTGTDEDGDGHLLDRYAHAEEEQPDRLAEQSEKLESVRTAIAKLNLPEEKYLRMKGVDLDSL